MPEDGLPSRTCVRFGCSSWLYRVMTRGELCRCRLETTACMYYCSGVYWWQTPQTTGQSNQRHHWSGLLFQPWMALHCTPRLLSAINPPMIFSWECFTFVPTTRFSYHLINFTIIMCAIWFVSYLSLFKILCTANIRVIAHAYSINNILHLYIIYIASMLFYYLQ